MAVYPLHAHDIKFNVNPLTPNQVTFLLVDTKKHKFMLITPKKIVSCSFKEGHRIKIRAKLLLNSIFRNW